MKTQNQASKTASAPETRMFEPVTGSVRAEDYNAMVETLQATIESLGNQLINKHNAHLQGLCGQPRNPLSAATVEGNAPRVMNYKELDKAFTQVSNELEQVTAQRDKLLSACKWLAGFSYTDYAAKYGSQAALQELVAIKRAARRAIGAEGRAQ